MQYTVQNKIDRNAKIAVLCGGMSSEAEVSRRSGKNCFGALQRLGFKNAELVEVDKNIAQKLQDGKYDYAYNALHGKYGEDGCIQGILEILQIPYSGCGVMSSAICMNKEYTKRILSTHSEIPLAKSAFVRKGEDVMEKTKNLKYPVFTKPVSEGSSFGMTKVNSMEELKAAYDEAVKYNDDVLIEEFIDLGFDALNPLQIQNDPYELKKKYRKDLCFVGGFDNQGILDRPGATYEERVQEIRKRVEMMAPGGSWIAHPVMIDPAIGLALSDVLYEYNQPLWDKVGYVAPPKPMMAAANAYTKGHED